MAVEDTRAFYEKVGRRLTAARERRGIEPAALAAQSNMTVRRLGRYEAGEGAITVDELERLAAALRLPVVHFMESCSLCGSE